MTGFLPLADRLRERLQTENPSLVRLSRKKTRHNSGCREKKPVTIPAVAKKNPSQFRAGPAVAKKNPSQFRAGPAVAKKNPSQFRAGPAVAKKKPVTIPAVAKKNPSQFRLSRKKTRHNSGPVRLSRKKNPSQFRLSRKKTRHNSGPVRLAKKRPSQFRAGPAVAQKNLTTPGCREKTRDRSATGSFCKPKIQLSRAAMHFRVSGDCLQQTARAQRT